MSSRTRARDIGIPFAGTTGAHNDITDVAGVEVGYCTVIEGEPEDYTGDDSAFARTGVTAILPRGRSRTTVVAAHHSYNGYGEMTGAHYIADFGQLEGPIMLTNTFSVGVVRDAAYKWFMQHDLITELESFGEPIPGATLMYPVVGETYDGFLNNARGFRVTEAHTFEALENAATGPIAQGNVGGGTGMQAHRFKGGSGSSSRLLDADDGGYTVGVFVQANYGRRDRFTIRGIPMGKLITGCDPIINGIVPGSDLAPKPGTGSIIAVLATDAPLTSTQLNLLCKRIPVGIGLLGGGTEIDSGDISVGFSTAHTTAALTEPFTDRKGVHTVERLSHDRLDPLFGAVVDATEEAILNAMVAAETMVGINGNTVFALPHDQVRNLQESYGRRHEDL